MKATQVQTKPEPVNGAKPCSGPGCTRVTHHPYAKENGDAYFCQRSCWEGWRQSQPPRYPMGALSH